LSVAGTKIGDHACISAFSRHTIAARRHRHLCDSHSGSVTNRSRRPKSTYTRIWRSRNVLWTRQLR
jgi:hypothetical protein